MGLDDCTNIFVEYIFNIKRLIKQLLNFIHHSFLGLRIIEYFSKINMTNCFSDAIYYRLTFTFKIDISLLILNGCIHNFGYLCWVFDCILEMNISYLMCIRYYRIFVMGYLLNIIRNIIINVILAH